MCAQVQLQARTWKSTHGGDETPADAIARARLQIAASASIDDDSLGHGALRARIRGAMSHVGNLRVNTTTGRQG
jgi:hypothetical protein